MIGVEAGLEWTRTSFTLRPRIAYHRGVDPFADDLSICLKPSPEADGCYEPAYARHAAAVGLDVLVAPAQAHGFFGTLGTGMTAFGRTSVEPSTIAIPSARGHWRVGAGVTLGKSRRAPRVELARTMFMGSAGSAKRWTALSVCLQ